MHVIGAGLGRTGTYSLKFALNQLGLGPCHHMEEVMHKLPVQVPLWEAAIAGNPDWGAIYSGYGSAVDWPTASFYRELATAYPHAKFVLSTRSPDSWADSFGETIYKVLGGRDQAPADKRAWS
jgi:Sulfotransferase domain